MAALINRIGISENIPLEAKCMDLPSSNIEKIHNKGVIVDDHHVLVSSINWNSVSPNFNREAGVIIDDSGAAGYFLRVFDDDWNSSVKQQPVITSDYLRIAIVLIVMILLVILYFRRRRV